MAESSLLHQSDDERDLLQVKAALQHPFEPVQVPLTSLSPPPSVPAPLPDSAPSASPPPEDDTWQSSYASQVSEWRAQSAAARSKAELARANWEAIRAREQAERQALGQSPESWDGLGDHITTSTTAATETIVSHSHSGSVASFSSTEHVEHAETHAQTGESTEQEHVVHARTDGSPSQPWEHLSSSQGSSYPSMSFPEASVPQSPSHHHVALGHASASAPAHTLPHSKGDHNPPPSTLPSITDNRIATRTRLSLTLSSLAINLFLPFINGVMLGFGEIFAKDVLIGWFGWKTQRGSTAAGLGLRR